MTSLCNLKGICFFFLIKKAVLYQLLWIDSNFSSIETWTRHPHLSSLLQVDLLWILFYFFFFFLHKKTMFRKRLKFLLKKNSKKRAETIRINSSNLQSKLWDQDNLIKKTKKNHKAQFKKKIQCWMIKSEKKIIKKKLISTHVNFSNSWLESLD